MPVIQVVKEEMVKMGDRAGMVITVCKDLLVVQGRREIKDHLELLEDVAILEVEVYLAMLEVQESWDLLDNLDQLDLKGLKVTVAVGAERATRATKAPLDPKADPETRVNKENKAMLEIWDLMESRDNLVFLVFREN